MDITLEKVVDAYLAQRERTGETKQVACSASRLRKHLWDWLGKPVREISRQMCEERFAVVCEDSSVSVANSVLKDIKAAFNQAIDDGVVETNPWQRVKTVPMHREPPKLTVVEHDRIMAMLDDPGHNQDTRDFICVALFTGATREVILSVRWDDLDLERGTWNGTPLHVRCVQQLRTRRDTGNKALYAVRKNSTWIEKNAEWVFPSPVKEGYLTEIKTGYARFIKDTGIPGLKMTDLQWFWYFHYDLKHTRHAKASVMGSYWRELEVRQAMQVST